LGRPLTGGPERRLLQRNRALLPSHRRLSNVACVRDCDLVLGARTVSSRFCLAPGRRARFRKYGACWERHPTAVYWRPEACGVGATAGWGGEL